jgi:hypothetical protein
MGELLCCPVRLCCRRTIPDSEPRCTYFCEISGLVDSPAGQATWIYEKFTDWTDSNRNPESVISRDATLDDIMLYWITAAAASSAALYAENSGTRSPDKWEISRSASAYFRERSTGRQAFGVSGPIRSFFTGTGWQREATSPRSSSPLCLPQNYERVPPVSGSSKRECGSRTYR